MLDYPVTTPENVRFRYTLAGPASRLLAFLLDAALIALLLLLSGVLASSLLPIFGAWLGAVYGVSAFAISLGWWIVFEWRSGGRSPGKRILGLRVLSAQGRQLQLHQVLLRNLLRLADLLPLLGGLAALSMSLDPQHRRIGDLAAGTVVVRERRLPPPHRLRDVIGGREGSSLLRLSRASLLAVARADQDFLLDLCLRRDSLQDGVRGRLFAQAATWLRQRLNLGAEDGVSDEKLVLAVATRLVESREVGSLLG